MRQAHATQDSLACAGGRTWRSMLMNWRCSRAASSARAASAWQHDGDSAAAGGSSVTEQPVAWRLRARCCCCWLSVQDVLLVLPPALPCTAMQQSTRAARQRARATRPRSHLRVCRRALLLAGLPKLRLVLLARAALRSGQPVVHVAVQPAGGRRVQAMMRQRSGVRRRHKQAAPKQTAAGVAKACPEHAVTRAAAACAATRRAMRRLSRHSS